MAFQSRRLRVQLPCGERTVFEAAANVNCAFESVCFGGSFICDPNTCVFGRASECGPQSVCQFPTCDFGSNLGCGDSQLCALGSADPVDPGSVLVDPEDLPALRQHLEARLKDIDAAQQALADRDQG